jgi:gamma-glutamyltranspeptidase/glutathione hydrolase
MHTRLLFTMFIIFVIVSCSKQPVPQHAIATAHPAATAAGMEILEHGGNAFDAAVAISATLAVVEPYSSGVGGGGFWLLHRADDGKQILIDGREVAPQRAHRDMYLDGQGNVQAQQSMDGALAAAIPGLPAALTHLAKHYGKLPLKESLQPALRAAREGFVVTAHYRRMAEFRLAVLRASPAASAIFLHNNAVPPLGHKIVQTDLARTLEMVAEKSAAGFYQGETAQQLINGVTAAGGLWTLEDLKNYQIKQREPIVSEYRGYRIVSAPPPSSGGVALAQMFNMLSQFDKTKMEPVQRKHILIESMRRAYRDRAEFLGDPDVVKVPVATLISREQAEDLASTISFEHATDNKNLRPVAPPPQGNHTTHFSILDKAGNRVAATLSINYPFGSGFVAPGTGVLLNDEMDDFVAKPGVANAYGLVGAQANAIAPGKRMLSSMTPTFVEGKDKVAILGTPGGSRIITMVLQGILGVIEGQAAGQIVAQPRFHHQYLPNVVQYETGAFSPEEMTELQRFGHVLQLEQPYGNMQIVIWDKQTQTVSAASDPRGEGQVLVK